MVCDLFSILFPSCILLCAFFLFCFGFFSTVNINLPRDYRWKLAYGYNLTYLHLFSSICAVLFNSTYIMAALTRTQPFCGRSRDGRGCGGTKLASSCCCCNRGGAQEKKKYKSDYPFSLKGQRRLCSVFSGRSFFSASLSVRFNQSVGERPPPLLLLPVKTPPLQSTSGGRAGGSAAGMQENGWNLTSRLEFPPDETLFFVLSPPCNLSPAPPGGVAEE